MHAWHAELRPVRDERAGIVVAARGAPRDRPLVQLPVREEPGAGLVALLAAPHHLAGSR
jgi:hypothetical protein